MLICYHNLQASTIKAKRSPAIRKDNRLNDGIQARELRVIDDEGNQLGIISRQEALQLAAQKDLDLVVVSPSARPPVAKIIDWGKYNYQRTKQQKKNQANAKAKEMKQIRLGLKISDHDLGVKLNKVVQFFEAGHKVKFTIKYRGRELAHKELGFQLADKIVEKLGEYNVVVDQQPQMAGKQLNFVVRSSTNAKAKNS